ncbi:hypothetical protein [Dyadobacter fermentans]|uniref:DUF1735 domain-containing protein n=1 Tax=Dyadobacter fermentans (strain ATCC 700827 / DSM 18053 / CIP 107007 / KCTC 52180 / NS114) TaxID=471854 RepID=C6W6T2_DYAFD|nr:hypothetical protein [Dyadobacter fermentans]ACT96143.1 hypothetical protein Dfer_4943 [Dyadobacter fermentans DSM 18053]
MMKLIFRYIMMSLAGLLSLTGCYEEPDLFEELLVSNGKVAQIAVVWLGNAKVYNAAGVLQTTTTVDSLTQVNVNIEYTSEVAVREFRVYSAPTSSGEQTLLATVPAGAQQYDPELRNYVIKVPITAPKGRNVTSVIFAEVVAENALASSKKSATLKTNP